MVGGGEQTPVDGNPSSSSSSSSSSNYKYRKLLHLFKFNKHSKKSKKAASKHNTLPAVGTPEERRTRLDQDIRNSWDSLPETLRRRKQRVSRALLSEFIDADCHDAGNIDKPSPEPGGEDKPPQQEVSKVLDALHRSGVYYDDEDVDDEDDDTKSSTSSTCSDKNEVCIYQVQPSKTSGRGSVEVVTRAMFHQQDDSEDEAPATPPARPAPPAAETQIGEEEIYQKISFDETKCDPLPLPLPLERLEAVIPPEEAMEEIPLRKTEEESTDSAKDSPVAAGAEPDEGPHIPAAPALAQTPAPPPPAPPAPATATTPDTERRERSDGNSSVEAKDADDAVCLYSRPQPRPQPKAKQAQDEEKRASTPLGLDSEALAAVEMLARAVSSDSLLASPCGGSVSSGSPANSHSSLDNMKLHEDDSGTDVHKKVLKMKMSSFEVIYAL